MIAPNFFNSSWKRTELFGPVAPEHHALGGEVTIALLVANVAPRLDLREVSGVCPLHHADEQGLKLVSFGN